MSGALRVNCLQRLSADDTRRQRVNVDYFFSDFHTVVCLTIYVQDQHLMRAMQQSIYDSY